MEEDEIVAWGDENLAAVAKRSDPQARGLGGDAFAGRRSATGSNFMRSTAGPVGPLWSTHTGHSSSRQTTWSQTGVGGLQSPQVGRGVRAIVGSLQIGYPMHTGGCHGRLHVGSKSKQWTRCNKLSFACRESHCTSTVGLCKMA